MAELSRAMQAAAETARAETMTRFEAEAKGVVEQVQAGATDEAAALRRKADDDVAAIREWSKAEIARIREETEARIAARKTGLEGEMEQHAADRRGTGRAGRRPSSPTSKPRWTPSSSA